MKIAVITPDGFLYKLFPEMEKLGMELMINSISPDCDLTICWSVSQMPGLIKAIQSFPKVPIINYNWDIYGWHLTRPRKNEYRWDIYKKLLGMGRIWVPSEATKLRTKELFGLDGSVIKTFATLYDVPPGDEDYVLLPWREMPDECYGWAKKACEELNIPYKEPNKTLSFEDWQKAVANCSFIVSDHKEASTGSLALIEAAYLGKFTISNGHKYSAAREYLNGTGWYFDTYDELKACVKEAWERRPKGELDKDWIAKEYSAKTMAKRIYENIHHGKRNRNKV